jgi:hypothetical protein
LRYTLKERVVTHSAQSSVHADRPASSTERRRRQSSIADTPPQAGSSTDAAPKPSVSPQITSIQTLGAVIAWLSGAVAGFGAIFYAFGYLASRSYTDMLGVNLRSLRYDYTFYVQRGAEFFVLLVYNTAWPLFLALASVLAILFACRGCGWLCQKLEIAPRFGRFTRYRLDWRGIAYLSLLVLLAIQLPAQFPYPKELVISGILRSAAEKPSQEPFAICPSIHDSILSGNEQPLGTCFAKRSIGVVVIAALLPLAWFVSRDRSWAVLRTVPFAIVLATSLLSLAWQYGTLKLPIKFREASISDGKPPAKLYMLNEVESGYVFWDCSQQRTRWISIETDRPLIFVKERRTLEQILQSCDGASQ